MNDNTQYSRKPITVQVKKQHRQRKNNLLFGVLIVTSLLLAIILIWMLGVVSTEVVTGRTAMVNYGKILLHNGMDGYVLTCLLAFIAGASSTILWIKIQQIKHRKSENKYGHVWF